MYWKNAFWNAFALREMWAIIALLARIRTLLLVLVLNLFVDCVFLILQELDVFLSFYLICVIELESNLLDLERRRTPNWILLRTHLEKLWGFNSVEHGWVWHIVLMYILYQFVVVSTTTRRWIVCLTDIYICWFPWKIFTQISC